VEQKKKESAACVGRIYRSEPHIDKAVVERHRARERKKDKSDENSERTDETLRKPMAET
jgi:hypothetical protein